MNNSRAVGRRNFRAMVFCIPTFSVLSIAIGWNIAQSNISALVQEPRTAIMAQNVVVDEEAGQVKRSTLALQPVLSEVGGGVGGVNYAAVKIVDGVVQFYFASGKNTLCDGAKPALENTALAAKRGNVVIIASYQDNALDNAANEAQAKKRAINIRTVLIAQGVPEDAIIVLKPQTLTGTESDSDQKRRVDVRTGKQEDFIKAEQLILPRVSV